MLAKRKRAKCSFKKSLGTSIYTSNVEVLSFVSNVDWEAIGFDRSYTQLTMCNIGKQGQLSA